MGAGIVPVLHHGGTVAVGWSCCAVLCPASQHCKSVTQKLTQNREAMQKTSVSYNTLQHLQEAFCELRILTQFNRVEHCFYTSAASRRSHGSTSETNWSDLDSLPWVAAMAMLNMVC